MKAGIAPELLLTQVKNTAAWLWQRDDASDIHEARAILEDTIKADAARQDNGPDYLAFLLAAHYVTVATFVPTDVDARIRHHAWTMMKTPEEVAAACDVVDRVARWDARLVSARVIDDSSAGRGVVSGHDGEWLSVRAGALGRAGELGDEALIERVSADLDREIDREESIFVAALDSGDVERVLKVATILAHNLGDLSRVAAEWPKSEMATRLRGRYVRLGHPDSDAKRGAFVVAGVLNKAIMARENHRFLPLRKPRALRVSRELLLGIGPWFDAWGEAIAKSPALEDRDRAEVLAALLEIHARDPSAEGCLRAISALHRSLKGGVELLVPDLPARMRKDALRGPVRDALSITEAHFRARIERRYTNERATLPSWVWQR